MKILILEDERLSAERLQDLLCQIQPDCQVLDIVESVESAVEWWKNNPNPDLIFVDIHLADGSSFEFLRNANVQVPLVFTTAYDRHALEAFQLNSLDYLLKPIDAKDLERALAKFKQWNSVSLLDLGRLEATLKQLAQPFKQRFLVRYGDNLTYRTTEEISYFYADDKTVYLVGTDTKRYIVDYRLEQLEELLNPTYFFRINRKFIGHILAIQRMKSTFNGRIQVFLKPAPEGDVFVSKEKVSELKTWIDR